MSATRSISAPPFEVAIPSYQRSESIWRNTIATLRAGGVDWLLNVFVANALELERYLQAAPPEELAPRRVRFLIGGENLRDQRNAITRFYVAGARLFEVDDDVRGFFRKNEVGKLERIDDVVDYVSQAFAVCEKRGATLWGFYPVCNDFYMGKPGATREDLRPIIGTAWGRILRENEPELRCVVKSDIERSVLHYLRDGKLLRFDDVAPKQNARAELGGQQAPGRRDHAQSLQAALDLCKRFPDLVSPAKSKKGGHAEVRLKDRRRPGILPSGGSGG